MEICPGCRYRPPPECGLVSLGSFTGAGIESLPGPTTDPRQAPQILEDRILGEAIRRIIPMVVADLFLDLEE